MLDQNSMVRIGDVLTKAGVLTEAQLDDRLEIAKTIGQPIGQTLLQLGDVSKYQLRCVVQVQALVADGLLAQDPAVEVVKIVCRQNESLEDALEKVGFVSDTAWSARLGQLLLDSGMLTKKQLARGLVCSTNHCSPLGHSLIQLGLLQPSILALALALQKDIRTGRKTRDQALSELRSSTEIKTMKIPVDEFR
jgi:hypothetical protein